MKNNSKHSLVLFAWFGLAFSSATLALEEPLHPKIQKITEQQFLQFTQEAPVYQQPALEMITSYQEAKERLGERFTSNDKVEIRNDQGKILFQLINHQGDDCGFKAYFPADNVIGLECIVDADYFLSLKTGESVEGNPESAVYSPDRQFRLITHYNGQEIGRFIQQKVNNTWFFVYGNDPDEYQILFSVQNITWLNNKKFVFKSQDKWSVPAEQPEYQYYLGAF
ncbi:hypothetical protein [Photobacterium salinisoli]|uniref:hypothetical protein n=1 Tax=Photobacterium salinisoli TaxID=1616783 RepID=UPI0013C46B38|nr:hypothetical protein [Photobacterium salinisoli]